MEEWTEQVSSSGGQNAAAWQRQRRRGEGQLVVQSVKLASLQHTAAGMHDAAADARAADASRQRSGTSGRRRLGAGGKHPPALAWVTNPSLDRSSPTIMYCSGKREASEPVVSAMQSPLVGRWKPSAARAMGAASSASSAAKAWARMVRAGLFCNRTPLALGAGLVFRARSDRDDRDARRPLGGPSRPDMACKPHACSPLLASRFACVPSQ